MHHSRNVSPRNQLLVTFEAICFCVVASNTFVSNAAAQSTDRPSDTLISLAVESQILSDEAIDLPNLLVTSDTGIVTVAGEATNLLSKRRAIRAAKTIRGVRSVLSQILVRKSWRDDSLLTTDLYHALTQDAATEPYEVKFVVEDGVARMAGQVDSYAERHLAEEVATGVNGIVAVDNHIKVVPRSKRPDNELKADIAGLMEASAYLEDAYVDVAVDDGVVVLNGRVGTLLEKDIARQLCSVSGVIEIDDRGLEIDPAVRNGSERRCRLLGLDDAQIAASVGLAFRNSPRVLSYADAITVTSSRGVVTLRGFVGLVSVREMAGTIAANTLGVDRVRNHLKVRWDHTQDDPTIAGNVRKALERDVWTGASDIIVRVRDGHAALFGLVETNFEKRAAQQTAGRQKGVVHVDNNLTVVGDWTPQSDNEIEETIEDFLEWSFFDQASEIDVDVENGVAMIRGTVDTRRQWQRVIDLCIRAGARRPHNMLRIRYRPIRGRERLYVPMNFQHEPELR